MISFFGLEAMISWCFLASESGERTDLKREMECDSEGEMK